MKKKTNKLTGIIGLIVLTILISSCARDGRDGRDGFDGFDGRDGNANVISNTYLVTTAEWDTVSFGAEANRFNQDLTFDVVQNGLVSVFFSGDGNPNTRRWIAIPYDGFGYSYVENFITFEVYDAPSASSDTWYKLVIIPQTAKIEGVNMNDYQEVEAVYGLE